jgi:hypothetical protein
MKTRGNIRNIEEKCLPFSAHVFIEEYPSGCESRHWQNENKGNRSNIDMRVCKLVTMRK